MPKLLNFKKFKNCNQKSHFSSKYSKVTSKIPKQLNGNTKICYCFVVVFILFFLIHTPQLTPINTHTLISEMRRKKRKSQQTKQSHCKTTKTTNDI